MYIDTQHGKETYINLSVLKEAAEKLIEEHIGRYGDVYLAFSGGKESVVLAYLCTPWRDKISLVWVNTGYQAPHMVDFIRRYGDHYRLIELSPNQDLMDVWSKCGRPTELLDLSRGMWPSNPKWFSWTECCSHTRSGPLDVFLRDVTGHPLVISGIRLDDPGPHQSDPARWGEAFQVRDTLDSLFPLRNWTEADVMACVETEGLTLPMQYAEGVFDSLECAVCPVKMTKVRMAHLERHYPQAAAIVREAVTDMIVDSAKVIEAMAEAIDT